FFSVPPLTYIYTLSLHDALPILVKTYFFFFFFFGFNAFSRARSRSRSAWSFSSRSFLILNGLFSNNVCPTEKAFPTTQYNDNALDRKSTRLNSSHVKISYAVFCL